ncbi:hypothetical protein [Acinetobacter boissieri]|uniref:Uncharacterized protein n=1 Tax=Acinetobacter boissieri TaxID=1219383 RepID=A0A1G6KEA4_9GAMM|nr:hypothetical protein [Acinetobacter boissieri]SDC28895.1 hypothetical protein SAMN05421733_11620 [Acinetobacter boissieri]
MNDIVRIDARVVGFSPEPKRILSVCFRETGEILVQKEVAFSSNAVEKQYQANTIVVTDAPELIADWQMSFDAKTHLDQVISMYQLRMRSRRVEIENALRRYDPSNILQIRKIDKNGIQQEFDSSALDNGHLAVLLSVWASSEIALNYSCITPDTHMDIDTTLLPRSF